MTAIETIVGNIVTACTTDTFEFFYNLPSAQNMRADERSYPVVFLDPYVSEDKIFASNYVEPVVNLSLFIAYHTPIDDINIEWDIVKAKAWDVAKEIVIRLRNDRNNIKEVSGMKRTDIKNYTRFDINLSGCLLEIKVTFIDEGSVCFT